MADLVVVVPTRGRPGAARELMEAFGATRTVAHLVFAVDDDDPCRDEYAAITGGIANTRDTGGLPPTMVRALNATAVARAEGPDAPFAVGFMGDDHRPRTPGWDQRYLDALRDMGTGIVYGNDLLQRSRLATECAMTADIVRALGFMAPPGLTHLYVDNFWMDLGRAANCLRYLPDVVVEHMHPMAGKATWDDNYRRVNAAQMYERDGLAYERYKATLFAADVAKVVALRGVAAV